MLQMAGVGVDDVVYDLGCGDGRLCIAAARLGARAVGIDIEPYWAEQSQANAAAAGVEELTTFEVGDACDIDISDATVVTLYLVHFSMQVIAREVLTKARPGTRIVSHSFPIEGWEPADFEEITDSEGTCHKVYLWKVNSGDQ